MKSIISNIQNRLMYKIIMCVMLVSVLGILSSNCVWATGSRVTNSKIRFTPPYGGGYVDTDTNQPLIGGAWAEVLNDPEIGYMDVLARVQMAVH
jgi:hypothetical protein